ncbi:YggT family protein [Luteibacter rhizovicinus]|uniref:YggT family protein n=1 Tax=Luteibacter rhizovicinus TaxID=242606 RepID=A0A4R3YP99_9GAMM|nr:YggT family protein [Luteibacter rhizovicinus]TCV94190.1 YggT family protein [Luteibacter rhizovicinus]
MNYLTNAGGLIINFIFGAAVALFVLRLLAEAWRADFQNPICQFIYRYTNPVLRPLRKVLPNWRRLSTSALVVAWLIECLKVVLLIAIMGFIPNPVGVLVMGVAELLDFVLLLYIVLIVVWSLMSMLSTDRYHPVARLVTSITEPLLRPLRGRMVLGGLDFSPAVVLLLLTLVRLLVAQPLSDIGQRLMLGL